MSEFKTIESDVIKVGDPITGDLLKNIKENFDNHEGRISSLAITSGGVYIFNGDVSFLNFKLASSDIFYYTARQDFSINDFRVRLFTKGSIISGELSFDLQKVTDPNDLDDLKFESILASEIVFNFASATNYELKVAGINSSKNDILASQIIRVKITSYPEDFDGKVLMSIGAQ